MKRVMVAWFLLLLAPLPGAAPLPADWEPGVELARAWITAQLEEGPPQQAMNRLTGALAELADAEMALLYLQLHARLDAAGRKALRSEQTRWMRERDRVEQEAIQSEGGSLAATEANLARESFTRRRSAVLSRQLAHLGKEKE